MAEQLCEAVVLTVVIGEDEQELPPFMFTADIIQGMIRGHTDFAPDETIPLNEIACYVHFPETIELNQISE